MDRDTVRALALDAKQEKELTWASLAERLGRSPVYTAMLVYGYGQAEEADADALCEALDLPADAKAAMMRAPHRTPAQPWPPTDPFVYRFYEAVMLYGPVFKDVAHELFGDGIMSAIDMSVDIRRIENPPGTPRMVITLDGKWLTYKKF
jgi:cyanate lyase